MANRPCASAFWAGRIAQPQLLPLLDTFRYLDQLGRLAKQEVEVVTHDMLVASDYGMLDDRDFPPKPNYWGALLWRRLMGNVVLDSGVPTKQGQHVYAHYLRDMPGGVALLVQHRRARGHHLEPR